MESPLVPFKDTLHRLSRTDPDPRVRHRAQGLLIRCSSPSQAQAAKLLGTGAKQLRTWTDRFLAEGREGLVDRKHPGRPPKLDAAAREVLETALAASPLDYDYHVTTWTVVDLADLLERRGWHVHPATVHRTLHAMDFRYQRPRHDLTHRQDPEAVAAAKHVLAELQKRGLLPGLDSALSTWMNAPSTLAPTWSRPGNAADVR